MNNTKQIPEDWNSGCFSDGNMDYHLSIEDLATSRVSVAGIYDEESVLIDIVYGQWIPEFVINNPKLVRMIHAQNKYFDAHDASNTRDDLTDAINQLMIRELRKRGIR